MPFAYIFTSYNLEVQSDPSYNLCIGDSGHALCLHNVKRAQSRGKVDIHVSLLTCSEIDVDAFCACACPVDRLGALVSCITNDIMQLLQGADA